MINELDDERAAWAAEMILAAKKLGIGVAGKTASASASLSTCIARDRVRLRKNSLLYGRPQRAATVYAHGLRAAEEFTCYLCDRAIPKGWQRQVDHVMPLSKGGPHVIANMKPVCRPCNILKHNDLPTGAYAGPDRNKGPWDADWFEAWCADNS